MERFLVLDRMTKGIMNPNVMPGPDVNKWITSMTDPITGISHDYELVCEYEPYNMPVVDTRLINIITTQSYLDAPHPVYPALKQWLKVYSTEDIPADIKKLAVDNKEDEANETTSPSPKRIKYIILAMDNIIKLTCSDYKNSSLINDKKKKEITIIKQIADKIRANSKTKDDKNALIDAGINPDLDSDWLIDEFTEDVTL